MNHQSISNVGVSKNRGTPKSSHFNRVFHYFHHPFWGVSLFSETSKWHPFFDGFQTVPMSMVILREFSVYMQPVNCLGW